MIRHHRTEHSRAAIPLSTMMAVLLSLCTSAPAATGTAAGDAGKHGEPPAAEKNTAEAAATDGKAAGLDAMERKLEQAGWMVRRAPDGSLLLFPGTAAPASGGLAEPPMARLERQLRARGWRTRREADGSLVLMPAAPGAGKAAGAAVSSPLDEEMRKVLEAKGWKIREAADGSLLLYPPVRAARRTPAPCPGFAVQMKLLLPVASVQEARLVAKAWISQAGLDDLTVGKVRQVLKVFLVSLVSSTPPHLLQHQLTIRASDGHVILLN